MKTIKRFVFIALICGLFGPVVKGITIDGTAESAYGPPLAVQTLGSNASTIDPTNGNLAVSSGSQLDAAYGVVSNGFLYLLIAGNMQCDPTTSNKYDKLSVFIDTGAPGQNTLSNNTQNLDVPAALPRMSYGGDPNNCAGCPGLTFDSGFNASYWIGMSYGGGNGTNPVLNVNYADLPPGGGGSGDFLGRSSPTNNVLSGGTNPFGILAAMNNSNTGGVDTNTCNVNTNGAAQSIAAATVTTGVELAIPLNALGGASAVGPIRVVAFLTTNDYSQIYDQILGAPTISGCVDAFAFADPLTNNFSTLPGTHYFTVPVAGCNYSISPVSALYSTNGGSGTLTVGVLGSGCSWAATSSVPWITITAGSIGSGGGTVSYSVATNQTTVVRNGTITVAGTGPAATNTFTVTQSGLTVGIIAVDGTLDAAYGCPIAVQQIGTSYGGNSNATSLLASTGSQLDAAYGLVNNKVLFLFLAGNLQDNGNRVHIFFQTGPGGQNTLTNVNPNNVDTFSGRSVLNWMGPTNSPPGVGLTFDPGFAPNYWMDVACSTTNVTFNYAQMWPGGTNASGVATNGYYLGSNAGGNGILLGGTNPFGIQATINNTATNGVDVGNKQTPGNGFTYGCYTNAEGVPGGETAMALTVTNGIEMGIPLAAFGSPTGTIAICAFIANNGIGLQMANQILGPFGTNDPNFCMTGPGKFTNTPYVVLNSYPGQHYFYVGPEMSIASVSMDTNKNVHVSYLTENNTNLTYQLQRTAAPLSFSSAWTNVGPLAVGSGGIIAATDPSAGTNKPGWVYRVRQTPNCQ